MHTSGRKKLTFNYRNGPVDGLYYTAGVNTPLVIIVNGHNGFYNYGMFPYIQTMLFSCGISSYSFNFSHGGINGDEDFFSDLDKYEKNCMRLETEDLLCVLDNLNSGQFEKHSKLILLAHSLGGVPLVFGARKAAQQQVSIDGMILVSSVKTLNFWPVEMITEWASAGVFYKKNNRTKQDLPQGFEFLQEVLKSDTEWNMENAICSLSMPVLIVHGANDEAVPVEHGHSLFAQMKENNPRAELKIIPDATHTFNSKHPFEGASAQLTALIDTITIWIRQLP